MEGHQELQLAEERGFEWYQTASAEELQLSDKADGFEELFEDMLFRPRTLTAEFIACQWKDDTGEWRDGVVNLPDVLEYFSYSRVLFRVEDLGDAHGQFSKLDCSITVSPEYLERDSTILHELVHLHEHVVNSLPLYYHDALLWCLYKSLKDKIGDLDDRIAAHGHILNSSSIADRGGTHDILFLLKCFDLDIRMGYPLGTVFGYGREFLKP